nr:hypothetical protein [Deltaproteobacteria bacterium]
TPPNDLESSAVAAPTHRRTPTSDEVRHVAPALSSDPSRPPERTPLATRSLPDSTASEPSVDDTGSSEPVEATPQAPRLGRRIRAVSHYGGLLFLLRPMARCGAWEVLADLRERHACELRPMVHTLAGLMVPSLAPDDPARLALCGLPPFAEVPALSASDRARALLIEDLTDLSERVLATLTDLMSSESALEDPKGLLSWLVRRRVEILADPGWFELRFALDTVETEIRRAGLDCDPGFIPYLGVVIRFVYVER